MEQEVQKKNFHNNLLKLGQEECKVSKGFFKSNRDRLCKRIRDNHPDLPAKSVIIFKGIPEMYVNDTDIEVIVEQESNFWYLFGIEEPDLYGTIEVDTGRTTLFIPQVPQEYKMWMVITDKEDYKNAEFDSVQYSGDLEKFMQDLNPELVLIHEGRNSDSGLTTVHIPEEKYYRGIKQDREVLFYELNEQRLIKTEEELKLMRFICQVSSDAHVNVMRNVKPGLKEIQMEALFRFYMLERIGTRHKAYNCIAACGKGNATLHYFRNDKILPESAMILNDLGSKYMGYCSDITCSFPTNGKFTQHQKEIYNAVLDANLAVQKAIGEGVSWEDMHKLAERVTLTHLQKIGIVNSNFDVEEVLNARVGAIFQPHGLGHFIGLDVHDVGGYAKGQPERLSEPGLKSLRTRRTLVKNNVVTIEPGCYFIDYLLEKAFEDEKLAKYLNKEKVDEYNHVGGVRIEDDVVVLEKGCEVLNDVPRTVEQIEACMALQDWRKV